MNSSGAAWESLLRSDAPPASTLRAALLTTYDAPDERLLAEHLLPLLLKTSREPDGDGPERAFFLVELDRRLKELHDDIVVVSSAVHEDAGDEDADGEAYRWIWRNVRHLTVGSRGRAVQHAKLWLLHWESFDEDGAECVEVVVSSANLTMSALKGQVQGAWRACIPLAPRRSEDRLRRWGVMPEFLRELGRSSQAGSTLDRFVELLARAECPPGVSFVASVPGAHSPQQLRRTPWGVAGLTAAAPAGKGRVAASVLAPYVGSWSAKGLRSWCEHFGGSPDRLELVWIDAEHPWALAGRWVLPKQSLDALTESGAVLRHLRHDRDDPDGTDLFHDEHRCRDERWSHAKLYALRRGTSRRLLLTSANFSSAAWGARDSSGKLRIENFELGVCLDQAEWPFDLEAFEDHGAVATVSSLPPTSPRGIIWAQAAWNGRTVRVECRLEAGCEVGGSIRNRSRREAVGTWTTMPDARIRTASVAWSGPDEPESVSLSCGGETLCVPVFDERPLRERERSVPPEIDADTARQLLDQLLFEQYGGMAACDEVEAVLGHSAADEGDDESSVLGADEPADEEDPEATDADGVQSYAVPAFVLARHHLTVVDKWSDRAQAATTVADREWLVRDGELLSEAFARQQTRDGKSDEANALGAKLAVEELGLRVKHLREA